MGLGLSAAVKRWHPVAAVSGTRWRGRGCVPVDSRDAPVRRHPPDRYVARYDLPARSRAGLNRRGGRYRPVQTGSRFSMNARGPSAKSSVLITAAVRRSVSAQASSSAASIPRRTTSREYWTASGAFAQMR